MTPVQQSQITSPCRNRGIVGPSFKPWTVRWGMFLVGNGTAPNKLLHATRGRPEWQHMCRNLFRSRLLSILFTTLGQKVRNTTPEHAMLDRGKPSSKVRGWMHITYRFRKTRYWSPPVRAETVRAGRSKGYSPMDRGLILQLTCISLPPTLPLGSRDFLQASGFRHQCRRAAS